MAKAAEVKLPEFLDIDHGSFSVYKEHPTHDDVPSFFKYNLVVELYSK